jgi:hypothetical protein
MFNKIKWIFKKKIHLKFRIQTIIIYHVKKFREKEKWVFYAGKILAFTFWFISKYKFTELSVIFAIFRITCHGYFASMKILLDTKMQDTQKIVSFKKRAQKNYISCKFILQKGGLQILFLIFS